MCSSQGHVPTHRGCIHSQGSQTVGGVVESEGQAASLMWCLVIKSESGVGRIYNIGMAGYGMVMCGRIILWS